MRMGNRASLCAFLLAACGGGANGPALSTTTESVEMIAVPLTAASADIAASELVHEDLEPPWSLTASDGSGLLLSRVEAKAVYEGPLAYTELHLYFYNPENRVREGTFQITLPQAAAVSRFAMETNGQWMEAEVVEKQLARRAYDDFLHMRQDPALLEKAAGNQFTAKVFPIAGRSEKHIVISYSQELAGAQYVLPLRGLPKTERVDVSLAVTGQDGKRSEQTLSERNWVADRDFTSTVATASALSASGVVAAQIQIGDAAGTREAPAGITVMVDTSASRALGYAAYVRQVRSLVESLVQAWGPTLPIQVVAFDQDAEMIFSGKAYELGDAHVTKLLERGAAGASDLGQALAWVGQHAPLSRVLVVTDGVITAGNEGEALQKQVKALASVKVERIDFAIDGGLRDEKAMAALVRSGLQRAGTVLELDKDPVATAIAETVSLDVAIEIPGADWIYPKTFPTARAGQRATVYARMKKPTQELEVRVAGRSHRVSVVSGTQPLVERAVASAEIAELEDKLVGAKRAEAAVLRTAIAKKSVAARVISSQTSLLVLESDSDFARYGIDRRSLADILVVGPRGIERKNRAGAVIASAPVQLAADSKDKLGNFDRTTDGAKPETKPPADAPKAMKKEAEGVATLDDMLMGTAGPSGASAGSPGVASSRPSAPPPPPSSEPTPASASPRPSRAIEMESSGGEEDADPSRMAGDSNDERSAWPPRDAPPPLTGELSTVMRLIRGKQVDAALRRARDWHAREVGNVLALIALGEALEAKGSKVTAARVYGSIIDLFPGRADMRRFAGERLARLTAHAPNLIVDTYRRAVADRPDHMTGHRLLAYALVRAGMPAEAFTAILAGIDRDYRGDSYAGGDRVLREDATMIAAAYAAGEPTKRDEIAKQLAKRGLKIATKASTRFILYWETDANDVDFHIQDARGGHAFYSNKELPSGGELYADITTGYGPECFAIAGTPKAGPYRLSIDYYSQGPMGYGMGLLQVQRFDGKGGLTFEDRPYVIMNDHAYVDLGVVR